MPGDSRRDEMKPSRDAAEPLLKALILLNPRRR